jgi:hypothetical protein
LISLAVFRPFPRRADPIFSMIFRALVFAAFLLVHGELRAEPLPADAGFAPKLRLPGTRGCDPEIEESRPLLRARLGLPSPAIP